MFKVILKMLAMALVITAGGLFISGSHASADVTPTVTTDNCSGAPYSDWGYKSGAGSLPQAMSTAIVRAVDTSTGAPVNTNYTLNSYYNGNSTLDARIFQWIPGSGPANRVQSWSHFSTGENLKDTAGGEPSRCNGWSVIGPGDQGKAGDGYVLDCGALSTESSVKFWISHVDNPLGPGGTPVPGQWDLYKIDASGNSIPVAFNINNGGGNVNLGFFYESNGNNLQLVLKWTPTTWHLNGSSTVNGQAGKISTNPLYVAPNAPLTFRHYISDTNPSGANYSWRIVVNGVAGGWQHGPPDPNGYIDKQTAPPNNDGTVCEHIEYTNANGPGTANGSGQAACAKVQAGTPHRQVTGSCQSLSITEAAGGTKTRTYVSVSGVTVGRVHYHETVGSNTNVNSKWWPSKPGHPDQPSDQPDLGQSNISTYVGPGSGHDPPDYPNVAVAPAWDGEKNLTVTKDWSYQPNTNVITVTYETDTMGSSGWNYGATQYLKQDGTWTGTPTSIQCFSATCTIDSVTGDVQPGGLVATGGTMHITGTYTNTSPAPDYLTLWNPVLQYAANGQDYPAGGTPSNPLVEAFGGGGSYGFSFDVPNTDTTPNVSSVTLTPVYFNNQPIGPPCTFNNIWSFQQFSASAVPYTHLSPTREAATQAYCYAYLSISGTNHTVNLGTYSTFTKNGGVLIANGGGTYNPGTTYTIGGNAPTGVVCANVIPTGYDQFCTNITLNYTGGWVGPDSNVYDGTGGRPGPPNCDNEYNEPYFKVMGAGAAADVKDVEKPNASGTLVCNGSTLGGLLAGWNDNTNDGSSDFNGVNRGAGSQLSALALLKITGFASAQTTFSTTSGVAGSTLSFANSGKDASGATITPTIGPENPALGGSYGSQARCVKPPQPDTSVTKTPSPVGGLDLSTVMGQAKSYKGNLTLSNSAPTLSDDTSIFVDGDVYISNDFKLNQTGWSIDNSSGKTSVPSFTLTATGNIYIAPTVTQLDGLYVSSGSIYTCGQQYTPTSFVPMAPSQLYDSCNNQLVFNGSVMADQVKMMRTFGSLRDEKPHPGIPGTPGTPGTLPAPQISLGWTSAGNPYMGCLHVDEPSDPNTWNDNYLCEGAGGVALAWTHYANNPSPSYNPADGWDSLSDLQAKGYLYCTQWNVPSDPDTWYDNWLCANKDIGLTFSASNLTSPTVNCANISESSDPDANWSHGGYWLCANYSAGTSGTPGTPATPATPNLTPACSHAGRRILPYTCAAEVIHFSPELYLGNQKIDEDNNGAANSITSLPPVL